jgi:ornithine carbamoyltransferase
MGTAGIHARIEEDGMPRHFLSAADLNRAEAEALLDRAAQLKAEWATGAHPDWPLRGKTLALVFEKPSLRTRVAFEAGMTQLGGHGSYLSANDIDMGGRESVPDVARNLSRSVQAIAARVFKHATVETLARYSSVPVINALCDREHPCQALADLMTLRERYGRTQGLRLAYVGDGNNVCHSLMLLGATLGVNIAVACPPDYRPDPEITAQAEAIGEANDAAITITSSPVEAVSAADAVYTDVWTSMGQEHEAARRRPVFAPYQVNSTLLAEAGPNALVMHCLPVHRGEEVTAEVIDGPQSVVFDQAENRLHVQKALILTLLGM